MGDFKLDDNYQYDILSARERATLRKTLDPSSISYRLPENSTKLDQTDAAILKLRELELSHSIQRKIIAHEAQMKLRNSCNKRYSPDSFRGVITKSINFHQKCQGEIRRVYDQYHISPPVKRRQASVPKRLDRDIIHPNNPRFTRTSPPKSMNFSLLTSILDSPEYSNACVNDPFSIFCNQQDLMSTTDVTVKVIPPKIDKKVPSPRRGRERNAKSARRGKKKDEEPPPPVIERPKRRSLILNKAKLSGKGIIDLDNGDFMDYFIERVEKDEEPKIEEKTEEIEQK